MPFCINFHKKYAFAKIAFQVFKCTVRLHSFGEITFVVIEQNFESFVDVVNFTLSAISCTIYLNFFSDKE